MALKFTKLSRSNIRGLKPGQKITEHGINAECLTDGDIRYSVNIMVDGERIHRVIGRASDKVTRTQAEDYIHAKRAQAREGRLELPKGRKIPITFSGAASIYLQQQRELDGKDLESKERHLRLHLQPYFGNMQLVRITRFTVEKFRNQLKRKGMAEGGVVRVLATYRHMGRQLCNSGIIPTPPPMVRIGRLNNRREFIFSASEETALLEAASQDGNPYIWLFIKVGLATSLRHSELLSVRFLDLDTQRRRLRVRAKGGELRDQPLTQEITEILVDQQKMADEDRGWIFPNPASQSGHFESMKKPFRRCVLRAGLDPTRATPHTMRHTAITNFAETGAGARTIQRFSGHKSEEMLFRYTHAREERVDDALKKMQAAKTEREQMMGLDAKISGLVTHKLHKD